ncbi:uncharacterized protein SCODWIG_02349 [Saccharomycodes ludwigii]|uniref:Chromatin structure-remodeling complex subunit RSC7 n=1 Tax=Saccharomycodes ludwigii TaxID=36035 RepID=A0A376B7E3_9ASCO|nr:hypothetical protein SCDLUD_004022 [Saccharomycodes ludwigii]KAH3899736.1 hypothetical protein SCDLUD_004022 [Saccharomycodes ludwigii]SSD60588.1 uncharacterized protein SCODWIG_02349 [Saccharomycodes ludwigii]
MHPKPRGRPPKRKYAGIGLSSNKKFIQNNKKLNSTTASASSNTYRSDAKRARLGLPPLDENGKPIPVKNDEYVLPIDEEGETKIDSNGNLLDGREFIIKTFQILQSNTDTNAIKNEADKDTPANTMTERKYMISTEIARTIGFRDSYLFFQYNPTLHKVVLTQEQKNDLISRGMMPYSYKSRVISVVTARSCFRAFGSRIIKNGRFVTDDYYAKKLRESGEVVEGAYVNAKSGQYNTVGKKIHANSKGRGASSGSAGNDGRHNSNKNVHGAINISSSGTLTNINTPNAASSNGSNFLSSLAVNNLNFKLHQNMKMHSYSGVTNEFERARKTFEFFDNRQNFFNDNTHHHSSDLEGTAALGKMDQENWMYQHAVACSRFNSTLLYDRQRVLLTEQKGLRDVYTNTLHIPAATQSCKVIKRTYRNEKGIVIETKLTDSDINRRKIGLKDFPLSLFENCVSDEIKRQILKQRQYELEN